METGKFIYILLFAILLSCSPKYPVITEKSGVVVSVMDERTLEVMYNVVNRGPSVKVLNIYYWPDGHGLKVGDQYPPCYK